jgi:hypothetical protein
MMNVVQVWGRGGLECINAIKVPVVDFTNVNSVCVGEIHFWERLWADKMVAGKGDFEGDADASRSG